MRTQVCIIGGGPAGMLLSHILDRNGIDSVVLERQTKAYVLQRIRAGVLESGSVNLLREVGLGERMKRDGYPHNGSAIAWEGRDLFFIDTKKYTGKIMMTYGQTALTEDLYATREADGGKIVDEAANAQPHDVTSAKPYVTYQKAGATHRIDCDYIAGCDGFHGVSRTAIPASVIRTYEKGYPFGWLGIMSETPPYPEMVYCYHSRGFALASMRNPMLSRYYIQCDLDDAIENWPDDRFWQEFKSRMPKDMADKIVTGPSIEKSIAPLRSFVAEPMRYGSLFLAGDAAHIVPPTGAKGTQSRNLGCLLPVARPDRILSQPQDCLSRQLFRHRAAPRMGRGAHVLVYDHAAASVLRRAAIREAIALQPVRLPVRLRTRAGIARRTICGAAALEHALIRYPDLLPTVLPQAAAERLAYELSSSDLLIPQCLAAPSRADTD